MLMHDKSLSKPETQLQSTLLVLPKFVMLSVLVRYFCDAYMPNVNERIKAGIAPSFDLSDMRSVIHFVDAFQKQQCRSLLYHHFKAKSSSIIPESTLRLAWNTASSCKPPVLSKDQWRQLTIASSTAHTPGYRHPTADLQLGIELTESIKHFGYNGLDGHDNIWILKPTNANRGRGIRVVRVHFFL